MARRASSLSKTAVGIERDIGSEYDNVRAVADSLDSLSDISNNLDNISNISNNLDIVELVSQHMNEIIDVATRPIVAQSTKTWVDYVYDWDVEPVSVEVRDDGEVFKYAYQDLTLYRYIPEPYVPSSDAFYQDELLSDFLVARGGGTPTPPLLPGSVTVPLTTLTPSNTLQPRG
jgi:hypothetical protein